jgi:hypothetical protein
MGTIHPWNRRDCRGEVPDPVSTNLTFRIADSIVRRLLYRRTCSSLFRIVSPGTWKKRTTPCGIEGIRLRCWKPTLQSSVIVSKPQKQPFVLGKRLFPIALAMMRNCVPLTVRCVPSGCLSESWNEARSLSLHWANRQSANRQSCIISEILLPSLEARACRRKSQAPMCQLSSVKTEQDIVWHLEFALRKLGPALSMVFRLALQTLLHLSE